MWDLGYFKFIELEIKYHNLSISDEHLIRIIKNNKNFLDEKSKFDRIKYEKFLIASGLSAALFESNMAEQEKKRQLLNFLSGGIEIPHFLVQHEFNKENQTN